ncbi:hypothetical protein [Chitinimonas prasina]|uniref:hypothetical protein n=1 Tax=Chitinimonas prasina TaxID=1434937 RepID=UPI0024E17B0C|nr:hypothetical protein [Chitinimonas prasina]
MRYELFERNGSCIYLNRRDNSDALRGCFQVRLYETSGQQRQSRMDLNLDGLPDALIEIVSGRKKSRHMVPAFYLAACSLFGRLL